MPGGIGGRPEPGVGVGRLVGVRVGVAPVPVGVRVLVAVEAPPVGVRVGVFVLVAPGTGVLVALAPPKSVASAMILFCTDTPYGLLGVKLVFVPVSRHGQPSLSNIQAVQLMWR